MGSALKACFNADRYQEIIEITDWVRDKIQDIGFKIIASKENASPGLLTISLPDWLSSEELGQKVQDKGFLLHWRSRYLFERNWIQIALMGRYSKDQITLLFKYLSDNDNPIRRAL